MAPNDIVVSKPSTVTLRHYPGQNSRRLLGRITSPQTDLVLPISSYMGIVTQVLVDGTFQPLRPQGDPLRFHPLLNRLSPSIPSSFKISTQTTSLMIYFELLPQSSIPWVPVLGKSGHTPKSTISGGGLAHEKDCPFLRITLAPMITSHSHLEHRLGRHGRAILHINRNSRDITGATPGANLPIAWGRGIYSINRGKRLDALRPDHSIPVAGTACPC